MNGHRLFYAIIVVGASLSAGLASAACSSESAPAPLQGADPMPPATSSDTSSSADASVDATVSTNPTDYDASDAWPTTK